MRGIAGLLVVALASSLSACEAPTSGQHKTAEVAPGTKFRPAKIEDLDGWRNVRVIRTKQVRRTECDIVFPERFGLSPDEFDLLIYIVASSAELQRSSDCWASQAIYQTLDQLLSLATKHQFSAAASALLRKQASGMTFMLDGALAEDYTESYVLPALEGFSDLPSIVDAGLSRDIAKEICARLGFYEDVRDPQPKQRVVALLRSLSTRGEKQLAEQLRSQCATEGVKL